MGVIATKMAEAADDNAAERVLTLEEMLKELTNQLNNAWLSSKFRGGLMHYQGTHARAACKARTDAQTHGTHAHTARMDILIGRPLRRETMRFDPADLVAPEKGSIEQKIVIGLLVISTLTLSFVDNHRNRCSTRLTFQFLQGWFSDEAIHHVYEQSGGLFGGGISTKLLYAMVGE